MVKITGRQQVDARLSGIMDERGVEQVTQALFVAGNRIQVDAQHSITEGAVSGKYHVPSLPGQPPKADTHTLDRQIETSVVEPLHVRVASEDPKSAWLELGTSRMAARPFMGPAAQRHRKEVVQLVRDAVNRAIKRAPATRG